MELNDNLAMRKSKAEGEIDLYTNINQMVQTDKDHLLKSITKPLPKN